MGAKRETNIRLTVGGCELVGSGVVVWLVSVVVEAVVAVVEVTVSRVAVCCVVLVGTC